MNIEPGALTKRIVLFDQGLPVLPPEDYSPMARYYGDHIVEYSYKYSTENNINLSEIKKTLEVNSEKYILENKLKKEELEKLKEEEKRKEIEKLDLLDAKKNEEKMKDIQDSLKTNKSSMPKTPIFGRSKAYQTVLKDVNIKTKSKTVLDVSIILINNCVLF